MGYEYAVVGGLVAGGVAYVIMDSYGDYVTPSAKIIYTAIVTVGVGGALYFILK